MNKSIYFIDVFNQYIFRSICDIRHNNQLYRHILNVYSFMNAQRHASFH